MYKSLYDSRFEELEPTEDDIVALSSADKSAQEETKIKNRYEITYTRYFDGAEKTVTIYRYAENARDAVEAYCDQYGWREKLDMYDADTMGLEWSRHSVATDGSINWDLTMTAMRKREI